MNITKAQNGQETLHPFPVPLRVWNHIGIGLLHPPKEIDSYRYIVTEVNYTIKFIHAEPF